VEMRAFNARVRARVKTLEAHGSSTVEEAEVVSMAFEGRDGSS
jgi:hypothetical protein